MHAQTGKLKEEAKLHEKEIKDLQIYKDGTHLVTASTDKQVRLREPSGLSAAQKASSLGTLCSSHGAPARSTSRRVRRAGYAPQSVQVSGHLHRSDDGGYICSSRQGLVQMIRRQPQHHRPVHACMQTILP